MSNIKIKSFKNPDFAHYDWEGELLELNSNYALVLCLPGRKLTHYSKNTEFILDNVSLEYFDFINGFTVAMSIKNDKIVSYYCNISSPCKFSNNCISYIDYDLDFIKKENCDWELVDEDEYLINIIKYNYSEDLKIYIDNSLKNLKEIIFKNEFPFNINNLSDIINRSKKDIKY